MPQGSPLRALGDAMVRSEWRAMVAAAPDRSAWAEFQLAWARYADTLSRERAAGGPGRGGGVPAPPISGELSPDEIAALSPDQRATLRRMAEAAGELAAKGKPPGGG
jgi:hypothetical protein